MGDILDNSTLFFKIFRNIFLKEEIFKHVKLYRKYRSNTIFKDSIKYRLFKFKEYLSTMEYSFSEHYKIPDVDTLTIGNNFWGNNKQIQSVPKRFIPSSVTNLTISKPYDERSNIDPKESLCNFIPPSVTKLNLLKYKNPLKVGDFHKTLESLSIVLYKTEKLENNCLPNGLKDLNIYGFQSVTFSTNLLPFSLTTIKVNGINLSSMDFRHLVHLKYISVETFNGDLEKGYFSEGLESLLIFVKNDFLIRVGSLPKSLKKLFISEYKKSIEQGILPDGLQSLNICGECEKDFEIGALPSSITYLDFGPYSKFLRKIKVGVLPLSLSSFHIPNYPFEIEEGLLPKEILSLTLPNNFNQIIKNSLLPNRLIHIDFGKIFNSIIPPYTLPETLKSIRFGECFNQEIYPGTLPNSIDFIVFTSGFNKPIRKDCWPKSLQDLDLGNSFESDIEPYSLPSSLKNLIINGPFNKIFEPNTLPLNLISLKLPQPYTKEIHANLPNLKHLLIGTTSHYEYFLKRDIKDYDDLELLSILKF
ncbi:hypothetical protein RB653_001047 [Dictyostelium firmibasis]|uniref:FNIP repeat-containing protein n=1 Tax=Dictyostelium firmibasis TaxID=79012 RepID=A0AAN7U3P6_9MYCE